MPEQERGRERASLGPCGLDGRLWIKLSVQWSPSQLFLEEGPEDGAPTDGTSASIG